MGRKSAPVAWAEYLALRTFAGLTGCFSAEENLRTAGTVGRIYHALNRGRAKRAEENIALSFPDWPAERVAETALRSMEHTFRMFMVDALAMPRLISPASWTRYIELGNVGEALRLLSTDEPVILVTGHCGNWEMLGFALAMLGFPIHALARPLDNPLLDRWLLGVREARGLKVISKWGATDEVQNVLREGGKVGFIADQNAGDKGLFVPFFGRLASCYKSMGMMAMRYKATVVAGHATRLDDRLRYRIAVTDIIRPADWHDTDDPLFYLTARISRALELMVMAAPEQYLWLHRRWKSRPKFEREGEPMPERLVEKIRSLPWMTEPELERIVRYGQRRDGAS